MAIVTRYKEAQTPQSFAYIWVGVKDPRITVDSWLGTILGAISVREFARAQISPCGVFNDLKPGVEQSTSRLNGGNPCRGSVFGYDGNQILEPARLLTFAVRALPFLSKPLELASGYLPPARMQCGRHACHLAFSTVRESPGGRPKSSPLPGTRFQ
jgi:hypothetical protein